MNGQNSPNSPAGYFGWRYSANRIILIFTKLNGFSLRIFELTHFCPKWPLIKYDSVKKKYNKKGANAIARGNSVINPIAMSISVKMAYFVAFR